MTTISNKEKAVAVLKAIETGSKEALSYIDPKKYIQHDLAAPDGLTPETFDAMLRMLDGSGRVNTVRVFQDGDYVFAHSESNFFGPKINFDIFRFENGLIVEHWDNLQEKPGSANASGHTMTDGPTKVTDLDKTEANKALINEFWEKVVVGRNNALLANYIDGERLIAHNPFLVDGVSSALEAMMKSGNKLKCDRARMVLGEGNFVLVGAEGSFNDKPAVFYDLFRIENGKIAERWDVIESTLPKGQWKNTNGKF